jgi:hypothetical protein
MIVYGFFLTELANLNSLHLDTFVIASGDDTDNDGDDYGQDCADVYDSDDSLSDRTTYERMNEQAVLSYVNRAGNPDLKRPLPSNIRPQTWIFTHSLAFDTTTCELSAFHATRDNHWTFGMTGMMNLGIGLRRHLMAGIWLLFSRAISLVVKFRNGIHASPYVFIVRRMTQWLNVTFTSSEASGF